MIHESPSLTAAVRTPPCKSDPAPGSVKARHASLPCPDTSEGSRNFGGNAVLNLPTGEHSAVRVAALYQDDDGFIDDVGLGRENINDKQRTAARLSWLWNSSDAFDVLVKKIEEQEAKRTPEDP